MASETVLPPAVREAVDANPWPHGKGGGKLFVTWRAGVEKNIRTLDQKIGCNTFTATQVLHRMTVGAINLDNAANGWEDSRPTLAQKWGPKNQFGRPRSTLKFSVSESWPEVNTHVDALRNHLIRRIEEDITTTAAHNPIPREGTPDSSAPPAVPSSGVGSKRPRMDAEPCANLRETKRAATVALAAAVDDHGGAAVATGAGTAADVAAGAGTGNASKADRL